MITIKSNEPKHDLALLAKLLNKTPDEILQAALGCYVSHSISPDLRSTYTHFIEGIARTASDGNGNTAFGKRYRIAGKAASMIFNPDKTRGRIIAALKDLPEFSREDFRRVVAEVMSWKPSSSAFGISTKWHRIEDADRGWWGTFKGRDKLIEEVSN